MDELKWIEDWFAKQCDGDWEHSQVIKIATLDNPGWSLHINLEGTPLEKVKFDAIVIERSETDWIHCSVQNLTFRGFGGVYNLTELLNKFKKWATF